MSQFRLIDPALVSAYLFEVAENPNHQESEARKELAAWLEAKAETAAYQDEEDDNERGDPDYYESCGCRYCRCVLRTPYGATCESCQSGAHQG